MARVFENTQATFHELESIKPGEVVVYHRGAALPARLGGNFGVTAYAWELARAGRVYLFQRRTVVPRKPNGFVDAFGTGEFEYIAVGAQGFVPKHMRPL